MQQVGLALLWWKLIILLLFWENYWTLQEHVYKSLVWGITVHSCHNKSMNYYQLLVGQAFTYSIYILRWGCLTGGSLPQLHAVPWDHLLWFWGCGEWLLRGGSWGVRPLFITGNMFCHACPRGWLVLRWVKHKLSLL